jgi:hypothetical protein
LVRFGAPLLVAAACLCALPPSALADSALTITPTVADFGRIEPGRTATRYLAVTSSGSDAVEGDLPGEAVLKGTSRSAASIRPGSLVATPGSLSFGASPIGVMTSPQSVTLLNNGETPLALTAAYGDSHFRLTHTDCVRTIEPGAACTLTIAFQPGTRYGGPLSGEATVRTRAGVAARVPLTGTAIGPTRPVPPPPPPNYGSIDRDLADLTDSLPRLLRGGPARWRLLPELEAPTAGRLSLTLFGWNRARRLRIGSGVFDYDAARTGRLRFRLNEKGVALLRRPQRTGIKVVLKFEARSGATFRQGPEIFVKAPATKPERR